MCYLLTGLSGHVLTDHTRDVATDLLLHPPGHLPALLGRHLLALLPGHLAGTAAALLPGDALTHRPCSCSCSCSIRVQGTGSSDSIGVNSSGIVRVNRTCCSNSICVNCSPRPEGVVNTIGGDGVVTDLLVDSGAGLVVLRVVDSVTLPGGDGLTLVLVLDHVLSLTLLLLHGLTLLLRHSAAHLLGDGVADLLVNCVAD